MSRSPGGTDAQQLVLPLSGLVLAWCAEGDCWRWAPADDASAAEAVPHAGWVPCSHDGEVRAQAQRDPVDDAPEVRAGSVEPTWWVLTGEHRGA